MNPRNILLVKSHSMGIGDLLRSSAAWAVLHARWPGVQLHLLMLSKHAGYPSEDFIRGHHLLASAHFVTVKTGNPGGGAQHSVPMSAVCHAVAQALQGQTIDWVIDFESSGLKTAWLTRWIAKRKGARSVGIAQFPLRRFFYDLAAPSTHKYRAQHELAREMDYTERDFVALAALGLARDGQRIVLQPGPEGRAWRRAHPIARPGRKTVVLNIGCGTADAVVKRPQLDALVACCVALYAREPFDLHLSGAAFEGKVNAAFAALFAQALQQAGYALGAPAGCTLVDWSGALSLDALTGLLQQADLVVSSDSGPYHMAVGLGVPTLCWFNFDTPPSYHCAEDVACMVLPQPADFAATAQHLLRSRPDVNGA
jgi:ADP-heptose:LPS heptosyltransferase